MPTVNALKGDVVIGSIAGAEAREATEHEHNLSVLEAFKLYPTAIGWSFFFSLGIIMTAFDPQLLGEPASSILRMLVLR